MNKAAIAIALMAAVSTGGSAIAATNLLTNGTFESGSTGWSVTGTPSPAFTTAVAAGVVVDPFTSVAGSPDAPGTSVVQMTTSTGVVATISQTISVVDGTIYSIGYDLVLFNNAAAGTFSTTVSLGAAALTGLTTTSASLTAGTWVEKIVTFKATTTGTQAFTITYTPSAAASKSVAVDRAYVTNIPEPSTMLLLLGGAAGLMRLRRRKI